jgi:hypothetical protein
MTAYARYGAQGSSKLRSLSAVAADGSLVLTCPSDRFSRPGTGILRYSALLSKEKAPAARIVELRTQLQSAQDAGTDVRLVVVTPSKGRVSRTIHVRSDLVGKVVEFDGDAYVVDFIRPLPPVEDAPPKKRRR